MNLPQDTYSALHALNGSEALVPRSMPPSFYTNDQMLPAEIESLFVNGWVCAGRADEVPEVGDFYTIELFSEPLIVTRNKDHEVVVLSNVCRHRGSQLLHGRGNKKRFTCPYHKWSYALDGSLISAPLVQKTEGFDKSQCQLPTFKIHNWYGWIFINLSGTAEDFEQSIVGLNDYVKNYHPEEMRSIGAEAEQWSLNWKVLAENFMEGYHLSPVHTKTLHPMTPTKLCEKIPGGKGYTGYKSHYSESFKGRNQYHEDMTEEERSQSMMVWIYPGFVAAISPNSAVYMSITPTGSTQLQTRWDVIAREACFEDGEASERIEFARSFNAEDRERLLDVQAGLASRFAASGFLAPPDYEGTVWDFYHYVAERLLSEPSHR